MNIYIKLFCIIFYIVFISPHIGESSDQVQSIDTIHEYFYDQLTTDEKQWLIDHKLIILGANPDWPPIEFKKNNNYQGIAADYISLIEKIMGIRIEIITDFKWQQMLEKAQKKEIDGVTCIALTSKRNQNFIFTRPYYVCPYAMVSHQDRYDIRDIDSLKNKTVSIEKEFYLDSQLENQYPTIKKYYTKSTLEALKAVNETKADAYIGNLFVINYHLKYYDLNNIKIKQIAPFQETSLHIAVREDWPELVNIINKAIQLIPLEKHFQINAIWSDYLRKKIVLSSKDLEWINQHKLIKFTIDPYNFPIEFIDNDNKFCGISADYINLISQKLGIEMKFIKPESWKESIQFGEQNKVDMFLSLNITPKLKNHYIFTQPYLSFPIVIFVQEDSLSINSLKDLNYKKIAIVEGKHFIESISTKYPLVSIILVDNIIKGIDLLLDRKVDALIDNIATVTYYCSKQGISNINVIAPTPYKYEARFAVKKDWPELARILDQTINSMTNSEKRNIHNKWIIVKFNNILYWNDIWRMITISVSIIIIIIIILFIILLWNRRLRIEVARRKKLEQTLINSESQLTQIISFLPEPTWVINKSGQVVAWNIAIEKLTGLPSSEIIGKGEYAHSIPFYNEKKPMLIDIVNKWDSKYESQYTVIKFKEKTIITEKFYPNIGGGLYLRESACSLYNLSDELIGMIETIQDVTEQKQYGDNLYIAKLEAESANELKSNFLAIMSHEIRTPMNAIIGMSHLVQDTKLDEKQLYYVKTIQNSAHSLLRILNDILDFSKIESGKLEIIKSPFNLNSLLNEIYKTIEQSLLEKQLDYQLLIPETIPRTLIGDPLRVKQILLNLITNAIKFTEHGFIHVNIENIELTTDHIILKFLIKDSGIGISQKDLNNLFMPFSQADSSTTRKYGGSGLGLAICKKLTDLMEGQIGAICEQNIGTTFYFTLLFTLTTENIVKDNYIDNSKNTINIIEPESINKQILVVEDNDINQQIVKVLLEKKGFKVTIANNGKDSITQLKLKSFDLVLMDLQMPVMDGFEATKYIKSNKLFQKLPVIAMTAHAFDTDRQKCIQAGMIDFVIKPINPDNLYSTINKWIKTSNNTFAIKTNNNLYPNIIEGWPQMPGISVRTGLLRVDGNIDLYQSILIRFFENYQHTDEKIKQLIMAEDYNNAEQIIHSFKSITGSIGANDLFQIIQELELSIRNKNSKEILLNHLKSFDSAYTIVLNSIENLYNKFQKESPINQPNTTNTTNTNDLQIITPIIKKLYISVQEYDMDATEYMIQLKKNLTNSHFQNDLQKLENDIRKFDFTNCTKILQNIIQNLGINIDFDTNQDGIKEE